MTGLTFPKQRNPFSNAVGIVLGRPVHYESDSEVEDMLRDLELSDGLKEHSLVAVFQHGGMIYFFGGILGEFDQYPSDGYMAVGDLPARMTATKEQIEAVGKVLEKVPEALRPYLGPLDVYLVRQDS